MPTPLRPRVYVAGPISQGDPVANCQRAIQVGFDLMDLGYAPFVPHMSYHVDPTSMQGAGRYEQWIELDFSFISTCHALLRIAGISKGADREVAFAKSINIPVFYSLEELKIPKVRKRIIRRRIARNWYEKNKERNRLYSRRTNYKRFYGITIEQYQVMLQTQGGVCAICKQPPKGNRLSVDHTHHSRVIRGLLCVPCNGMIGWLERPEWLKNAMQYLQRSAELPLAVH